MSTITVPRPESADNPTTYSERLAALPLAALVALADAAWLALRAVERFHHTHSPLDGDVLAVLEATQNATWPVFDELRHRADRETNALMLALESALRTGRLVDVMSVWATYQAMPACFQRYFARFHRIEYWADGCHVDPNEIDDYLDSAVALRQQGLAEAERNGLVALKGGCSHG